MNCPPIRKLKATAADIMKVVTRSEGHNRRFSLSDEDGLVWIRAIQAHNIPHVRAEDQMEEISPERRLSPSALAHGT